MSRRARPAMTLAEVLVASAVIGILAVSAGAALVIAGHALPERGYRAEDARHQQEAVEQLCGRLFCATAFVSRAADSVEFQVPDETGDALPDTVRYFVSGGALQRTFNGGAPVTLVNGVQSFTLTYQTQSVSTSTTTNVEVDSGEVQLAKFDGWTGITPSTLTLNLSSTTWMSEAFRITPPSGVSNFRIVRVRMKMRAGTAAAASAFTVGVHYTSAAGLQPPATTPIATVSSTTGALSATVGWVDFTFSNCPLNLTSTDYSLVVKGSATDTVRVQYLYSTAAPADTTAALWTTNGGTGWSPAASSRNYYDCPFYVYGAYTTTQQQTVNLTKYYLTSVHVALVSTSGARSDSAVHVLNTPEVPTP